MAELNLADLVLKLIKEWRTITKPRQLDLLRICNQKYKEMEEAHTSFTRILSDIQDIVDKAYRLGDKNNESPLEQIRVLERERFDGRQKRLSQYEQASLYASEAFADRNSFLKTVPDPIIQAVQALMISYVDYFKREGAYNHELGHVFFNLAKVLDRKATDPKSINFQPHDISNIASMIASAHSAFEMSWIRFSRDYYRVYSTFADHGIFAAEKDAR